MLHQDAKCNSLAKKLWLIPLPNSIVIQDVIAQTDLISPFIYTRNQLQNQVLTEYSHAYKIDLTIIIPITNKLFFRIFQ